MSKLDEIMDDCPAPYPSSAKERVKALMLELVGKCHTVEMSLSGTYVREIQLRANINQL